MIRVITALFDISRYGSIVLHMESDCILVGTLFGGTGDVVSEVSDRVKEIVEKDTLEKTNINNEQIALGILYKRMSSIFSVYIDLNGGHLSFFKELDRR